MAVENLTKENNLEKIKESFGKFIVRPFNKFGFSGLVFDIDGENTNKLQSDITDNYVEDNSAIQDHIAKKPLEVTLKSYIGELVHESSDSLERKIQKLGQKLGTIAAIVPVLTASASNVKNLSSTDTLSFDDAIDESSDLWAITKNLNPNATKQQRAYLFFKSLYEQDILISLQTPWEFVKDMAIKTIVANQKEDSNQITDFSITLKKINTASTELTSFDKNKYQSRNKQQRQGVTDKGKAKGNESTLSKITGLFS